ncbi:hypothetical protein RN001_014887 [Aquatica leii]|uniref:Peptidase S1 domain-containing protein n=1 Tax=Aquatica leii TaxID=1421715 RepID=A0AAN7P140_9COLE|nr:hypothetical protein RN001_014887 [Aquatica leii]
MMKLCVLILCVVGAYGHVLPNVERIVNGLTATSGQFPYQASLRDVPNRHFCGGAIIGVNLVLTAAHCTYLRRASDILVVVGTTTITGTPYVHEVESVVNHEAWNPQVIANDIALVKLKRPVTLGSNVKVIQLETSEISDGTSSVVSGWGLTSINGEHATNLQYLRSTIMNYVECRKRQPPSTIDFVKPFNICGINRAGYGVCNEDSGGPLAANGKLVGVVSWSNECGDGCWVVTTQARLDPRIVGGENAPIGFFPYQASIKENGKHICNGVIVKSSAVITTAHCVNRKAVLSLSVLVGTIQLSQGGTSHSVKEVKIHEQYNSYNLKNDIAVVKLLSDIVLTSEAYPIPIGTTFVSDDVKCVLSGWGYQQTSGILSDYLQYVFLKTISISECSKKLGTKIEQSQLCTFTRMGEGPCQKDSGSPLVGDGFLIGIVSWGKPCAAGYPDVYIRISYYEDWLLKNAY